MHPSRPPLFLFPCPPAAAAEALLAAPSAVAKLTRFLLSVIAPPAACLALPPADDALRRTGDAARALPPAPAPGDRTAGKARRDGGGGRRRRYRGCAKEGGSTGDGEAMRLPLQLLETTKKNTLF